MKKIVLYAVGSPLIVDYEEICLKNNIEIAFVINNLVNGENYETLKNEVVTVSQINETIRNIPFLCTLFSPHNRFVAIKEALSYGLKPLDLLSDFDNDLPFSFKHGIGCFINKRVTIGGHSLIGDYVTINRGATLGHHLILEEYVSVGPGVVIGGNVKVSRGALIGAGAVILPKITIGKNAIVGAGSVVTKNVEDYTVVVGNPARKIKENQNIF
ncbi:MAG: acetyltransferase [Bacteroidetes bacterium]|nr:acetyltransferase [Bacteroidota bacterium]